jgi:Bacteriophage Sf6, terminase small subunit-like
MRAQRWRPCGTLATARGGTYNFRMARRTATITDRARQRFLDGLAEGHTVTHAVKAAGIAKRTVYDIRQRDETFALAWSDAIEAGTDRIEEEALRCAVEGTERPIMYRVRSWATSASIRTT